MKFQIISHACMLIEHSGKRLLIDPWILGSAYWRSWWHFPESVPLNEEMLSADWIYLTHQYFDHFHYPLLRKFRRDLTMLIPRRPVPSMERALADLGFTDVVSITEVTPGLLQDALEKGIVNFIDISKRLKVHLRQGGALDHFMYRELLTIYEQNYFPLWKNLDPRFLGVWFRRRGEIRGYITKAFRGRKSFIPEVGAVPEHRSDLRHPSELGKNSRMI